MTSIKLMLFEKRRASVDVADFQTAWRSESNELAMCLEPSRRVAFNLTLPGGYRRDEPAYDAITELWTAATDAAEALGDYRDAFGHLFDEHRSLMLEIDEVVICDGPVPPVGIKCFAFSLPRPGIDPAEFHRYWIEQHGPVAQRHPLMARYVQCHARSFRPGADGRPIGGCAITWWDDVDGLRAFTRRSEYSDILDDEPNFLDSNQPVVLANEHHTSA